MATAASTTAASPHISIRPSDAEPAFTPRSQQPRKAIRLTEQDRRFVELMAADPALDAIAAARSCGWKLDRRPNRAYAIQRRLQHLIDQKRLGIEDVEKMELQEAFQVIGGLARGADDERVRLGAVRTVLEYEGVLNSRQAVVGEGKELRRGLEALIGAVKLKLSKGQKVRIRQATQVEIGAEDGAEDVDSGTAGAAKTAKITPKKLLKE